MNRALLALVTIAVLAHPVPAFAGLWAWLEQWSGPGPFNGYTFLFTTCWQDGGTKASPIAMNDQYHITSAAYSRRVAGEGASKKARYQILEHMLANPLLVDALRLVDASAATPGERLEQPFSALLKQLNSLKPTEFHTLYPLYSRPELKHGPGHEEQRMFCAFADYGFFQAPAGRGYPAINAHLYDFGPSLRLHDGLDVGSGIGVVKFTGDQIDGKNLLMLTPLRVVVKPVLLAVPEQYRKKWMGILAFYWKQSYMKGKLTSEKLGAPELDYSVDGEAIRSFGLNFDIGALFTRDWKW